MLKTSFPDVESHAKTWGTPRVYSNRWLGKARTKPARGPHKFMTALERDALCKKLERSA